jgi:hypothetical protein
MIMQFLQLSFYVHRGFNMRSLWARIIIIGSAATLAGCASSPTVATRAYVPPAQIVHIPALNTEAEAEIGQTIISTANLSSKEVLILPKDVAEYRKAELLNNRWSGTTTVHAGTLEKRFDNEDGSFFQDDSATFSFSTTIPCQCGIFVPKDKNKPSVIYTYHREIGSTGYDFGAVPVEATVKIIETWSSGSFKRELIYGGQSGTTISISYREFADGTARPAFTQDIKYDLAESKIIGFRGARFEVAKASNTSLRYKVLKTLD